MEDTDLGIIFWNRSYIGELYFWTIFFFFERQRKVRNTNYRGSPLYPHFRKMKDTDLGIIFRLWIVFFDDFFFFFWTTEKNSER